MYEIIQACMLEDGLLAKRSAMYQGLAVMALHVFANTTFLSDRTKSRAQFMLPKAIKAWQVMSHPDGEIGLFNDSWFGEVPPINKTEGKAKLSGLEVLDKAGYARIQSEHLFVLFDAGAIGPGRNPGHGHADFLSFELDIYEDRFIVDSGTYQYSTGERRMYERSAQSHNGPCWNYIAPVDYHSCFKVGKMSKTEVVSATKIGNSYNLRGQLELDNGKVIRELRISESIITCQDQWRGSGNEPFVCLIIPEEWVPESNSESTILFSNKNKKVELSIDSGSINCVELGNWTNEYLHSKKANVIHLSPTFTDKNTEHELIWHIRRIA